MEDYSILELLEELKKDESWCPDAALRGASVDRMLYFIIEQ